MTTPEQAARGHLSALMREMENRVGRPLTNKEEWAVLAFIAGLHDLLMRGFSPEAVAAIARQEAQAVSMR